MGMNGKDIGFKERRFAWLLQLMIQKVCLVIIEEAVLGNLRIREANMIVYSVFGKSFIFSCEITSRNKLSFVAYTLDMCTSTEPNT